MDTLFVSTTLLYVVPIVLIVTITFFRLRSAKKERVRREEINKQAVTLLESLRSQYKDISYDETSKAFFTEAKRGKEGDPVLLRALSTLVDEKKPAEESFSVGHAQVDHYWLYFWLIAILVALVVSAILFAFTLIIPSITFSFVFVAIITTLIVGALALFKEN